MRSNLKRERSWSARSLRFVFTGARGLTAARSRFEASNPKRAHPPIPPHGRALTLRPGGEVEARALQVCARGSRGLQPVRRYYLAENRRRGPREQRPIHTEFVALSGPVFGRPRGAPRWVVGERTPPGRTGLRPRRPVGPGRRCWALGTKGRAVVPRRLGRTRPAGVADARPRRWNNGTVGRGHVARRRAGDMEVLR